MKLLTHLAAVALGFTTLSLLFLTAPLISPAHTLIYHVSGSASAFFLPVLFYLLGLWLLLFSLLHYVQPRPTLQRIVWIITLALLPTFVRKSLDTLTDNKATPYSFKLLLFLLPLTAALLLLLFWKPNWQHAFQRTQHFIATILGFIATIGVVVVLQLLWFDWQARALNTPQPLHQPTLAASTTPKPRIVWLLLDELSYRQVYEHRAPNLLLPAFDQFAQQATSFTNVRPDDIFTERVIPALFTGLPTDAVRSSADGHTLLLHNPLTHSWTTFQQHQTIWQDALDAGYSTSIAGFYNPYCRILPQVLDQCFWTSHSSPLIDISNDHSLPNNLAAPIHRIFETILNPRALPTRHHAMHTSEVLSHIAEYNDVFTAADTQLANPSLTFLFLHLPIPHPGGIYNRHTASLTTNHATYLDNLALADAYLAHVRTLLQQQHQWDATTVIIMGDHSWRTTLLWSHQPDWSPEEQAASDGAHFDDRPAYLIKLPYQHQPAHLDTPFHATQTRALLDALIHQQLHSPNDLIAWATQHP